MASPALLLPVLAGLGILLAAGKKDEKGTTTGPTLDSEGNIDTPGPKKRQTEKRTADAVRKKDWTQAAANALASGSKKAVMAAALAMKNAGLREEAKSLIQSFKELQAEAAKNTEEQKKKEAEKKRKKKPAPKKTKVIKKKETPEPPPKKKKRRKKKRKELPQPPPEDTEETETPDETPAPPPPPPPPSEEALTAIDVAKMLYTSSRYKEDRTLVEKYQRQNSLTPDGKYGPATAKTLWERYRVLPPNPFYWASSSDTWPYRQWLDTIDPLNETQEKMLVELKDTVGR